MNRLFEKKEDCFGCGACENICPKNAINMYEDEQGFSYPKINQEICVKCGLCSKVCQIGVELQQKNTQSDECFGFKNLDSIRKKSSSGGIYTAISDEIIKAGGVCIGVIFDEFFNVKYSIAEELSDRNKFRGSKYVQSKTGNIYKKVRDLLNKDRIVLFVGTPCQVSGLKKYLETTSTHIDNLLTIDMVCHGSPSPKVWKDYIDFIEKNSKGKLIEYSFRNKEHGWRGYHIKAKFNNGKIYDDNIISRTYVKLFSKDLIIRPSCFFCPYTSLNRVGDITIGDFWGIEKIDESFTDNQGISLIIINSDKGNKIFNIIENNQKNEIKKYDTTKLTQPNLYKPTDFGEEYEDFWRDYKKFGYEFIAKKYGNLGILGKFYYYKNAVKYKLKNK